MIAKETRKITLSEKPIPLQRTGVSIKERFRLIPWWMIAILSIAILVAALIFTNESFRKSFDYIKVGIFITLSTTFFSFLIALVLGLITGLGRISENAFFNNLATFYVEVVRGIPMLVLIFFIALVIIPAAVSGIQALGLRAGELGLTGIANHLAGVENNSIPMNIRAIIALSITYGAFLAEIFRAGIQSIDKGQMEAARSQGMTRWQAMWYIILPQAIRNVLPALGNDFISLLKDTSLVSILAVRDITQLARLYAGNTFEYQTTYITLSVLYLTMTILLSFFVKLLEKRYQTNDNR